MDSSSSFRGIYFLTLLELYNIISHLYKYLYVLLFFSPVPASIFPYELLRFPNSFRTRLMLMNKMRMVTYHSQSLVLFPGGKRLA